MKEHFGFGRKDTGRTDKYSDEDPLTDYKQYQADDKAKNARKEAREISDRIIKGEKAAKHVGPKSLAVKKQELIAHIQNFRENFNSAEQNVWENQFNILTEALKHE